MRQSARINARRANRAAVYLVAALSLAALGLTVAPVGAAIIHALRALGGALGGF